MVAEPPTQMLALVTDGAGNAAALTVDAADAVHPAAFVTVTLYVPTVVTEILVDIAPVLHT
jgi:hypothetical protein